jgi:hypothetical protein
MPITPGATGASFDVLLAFALDAEANRRVESGISTIEAELKRLQQEAAKVGPEYKESGEDIKRTNKEITRSMQAEARAMRSEAASLVSDIQSAQTSALNQISGFISGISQQALITGGLLTGGIFAEVNRFVKEQEKIGRATAATREWAQATEELGRARERVDTVLLSASLPLLQQVARFATQAAGVVERHPEIASLALKAGVLLLGFGALGTIAARGIKLVADIRLLSTIPIQLSAAKLQDIAADKQLAAARLRLKELGGKLPGGAAGGGVLAGLAVPITAIITATLAHAGLQAFLIRAGAGLRKQVGLDRVILGGANLIGQGLGRVSGLDEKEIERKATVFSALIGRLTGDIDENSKLWKEASESIRKAGGAVADATGKLSSLAPEVVEAFTSWKEDDARLIQEAADNRREILQDAEKEIADITKNGARERVEINRRFNEARADIIHRFEEEEIRAEQDRAEAKADAARNSAEQIQQIEADSRERLRQLAADSADRIDELERSRDALGIVKEQRALQDAQDEEKRSTRLAVDQVRRETAARMAEIDRQFETERARRRQEFEQALQENAAARAQELRQAAEAQAEELRQAREATAAKLREIQEGLNAERLRRREIFLAQIRDLDASLLGEVNLRRDYYNRMQQDAEAFFAKYRATLPGGSSSTSSLSGVTGTSGGTRSAAQTIGSSLEQETILRALAAKEGASRSVSYIDQKRISAPLSKDQRALMQKMAEDALLYAIGA